jgi:periplasmic protein TonB
MKVFELRMQYRKIFESSLIVSLLILTLMIRFLSWSNEAVVLEKVDIKMEVTKIDLTQQVKRPPPPSRPSIPIASETESLLGDETIDDTEVDLEDIPPPPPPPPKKEEKSDDAEVFVAYDTAPELKGGYDFIRRNLKYPDLARQAGIEGKVLIKAVIDEQGNVLKAEVLKEDGNVGFGQAAVDVVMKCKFTPARQRDKSVKVAITLPIAFKLK